jgi:hypothetical protein
VARIMITQAAFAGFGVLRRRPWAPVVWSALYVVIGAGMVILLGGAFIGAVGKLMTHGPKVQPQEVLGLLGAVFGGYLLMILVFWVIGAVVNMAVVRSVLEPEAAAFAYLRFGRAELWLMVANFVLFILYTLASMVMGIPVTIALALAVTVWRDAAPWVSLPVQVITWGVSIWLGLRFCMVPPLIFSDRRFRMFESWTMTRGRVGSLLGVGAIVVAVSVLAYVVLGAIGIGVGWPMFQQAAASGVSPQTFFSQPPADLWREASPFLALYAGLVWLGSIILLPVCFAPWAEVYRQLTHDELAATFS